MHAIPSREHRKISPIIHDQSAITPRHRLKNYRRISQHLLRPTRLIPILQQLHPSRSQFRSKMADT
jgi:hypothetical protein